MQGNKFTLAYHAHGVLAANFTGRFKLSQPATLERIQFSCSTATAATLAFGPVGTLTGIVNAGAIGQSGAVNIIDKTVFNGSLYTDPNDIENVTLAAGVVYVFTVTHASAGDVDLIFELLE